MSRHQRRQTRAQRASVPLCSQRNTASTSTQQCTYCTSVHTATYHLVGQAGPVVGGAAPPPGAQGPPPSPAPHHHAFLKLKTAFAWLFYCKSWMSMSSPRGCFHDYFQDKDIIISSQVNKPARLKEKCCRRRGRQGRRSCPRPAPGGCRSSPSRRGGSVARPEHRFKIVSAG